jgi:DNA polymerase III subunit gamma/tau
VYTLTPALSAADLFLVFRCLTSATLLKRYPVTMAYIALYRKYRSQSFGELMGQDAVTTVLQNSLKSGKIAHAYLFYGARGCGKTSTARLLSRALNCEKHDGPTAEPCGECKLCVAIRNGTCMDVVEIDAASETGVDNVREKIIENVQYAPTEARYKVYIIDEVHDLSGKAFDALLKTLEEPPAHVVFVLATTEQHKVPITIRSRCTQFQFKRGSLTDLSRAIQRVISEEGYTAEPEAVLAIARCAEGSWRDALSLLEQVLAYTSGEITEQTVQQALGTVGTETLANTVQTIAANDWGATLALAGQLIDSGKDVRQIITSMSGYLRDLLLIASGASTAAEQELGKERVQALGSAASLFTSGRLLKMLGMLAVAEKETRLTNQHRWLLERTLCSLMPVNLDLAEASRPAVSSAPESPQRASVRQPQPEPTNTVTARPEGVSPAAAAREAIRQAGSQAAYGQAAPPPTPTATVSSAPPRPAPPAAQPTPEYSPPPSPPSDRFVGDVTFEVVTRSWPRLMKAIEKVSAAAAGFMKDAEPTALEGKTIVIRWTSAFNRERILTKGRALVEKKINEILQSEGFHIRAATDAETAAAAHAEPNQAGSGPSENTSMNLMDGAAEPAATQKAAMPAPPETSILEDVLEIFGGEVIKSEAVKPPQ